jgi:L-threonylcarbamoyladenylate synthase
VKTQVIDDVALAAHALKQGKLVAFATETVYGLGVDATNTAAVQRLFVAKGRPADNPLIVHVGNISQWALVARELGPHAHLLLQAFAPGPITVVVAKHPSISNLVTAGLETVGLRIPQAAQARQLLRLCERPIAAPSANISGRPSCTTWQAVMEDLDGRVDYVLRGENCQVGIESTVVDCTGSAPVVLRAGQISLSDIRKVIPAAVALDWNTSASLAQASPGTRHPHYQPMATVKLFGKLSDLAGQSAVDLTNSAIAYLLPQDMPDLHVLNGFKLQQAFDCLTAYMQGFYEFLRQADRQGVKTIYLQVVEGENATGLLDRQRRAAGL